MSHDLQRVTKRIARQMAAISNSKEKNNEILSLFMGLGLALGACFEQATNRPFNKEKPQDILKWALDLPEEGKERRVTLQ